MAVFHWRWHSPVSGLMAPCGCYEWFRSRDCSQYGLQQRGLVRCAFHEVEHRQRGDRDANGAAIARSMEARQ